MIIIRKIFIFSYFALFLLDTKRLVAQNKENSKYGRMTRQKLIPTHMSSVKRTCFNSLSSADAILINKSLFQLPEISVIPEIISISTVYISRFLLLTFFLDVLVPLFSFFCCVRRVSEKGVGNSSSPARFGELISSSWDSVTSRERHAYFKRIFMTSWQTWRHAYATLMNILRRKENN